MMQASSGSTSSASTPTRSGEDEARAYVDLQFEEEDEVGTIDVPIAYYGPDEEAGGSDYQDALLSITFDTESGDVLQETYYAYHEDTGGYGELQTSPEGVVVPEVLVLDDGNNADIVSAEVELP